MERKWKLLILGDASKELKSFCRVLSHDLVAQPHFDENKIFLLLADFNFCILQNTPANHLFLELFKKQACTIPMLIFNDEKTGKEKSALGPIVVHCNLKQDPKALRKKMLSVHRFYRLRKSHHDLSKKVGLFEELESLGDITNFEGFIGKGLHMLGRHLHADNIFWLEPGDYEYFISGKWRVARPRAAEFDTPDEDLRWMRSWHHIEMDPFVSYLKALNPPLPVESVKKPFIKSVGGNQLVLLPIFNPKSEKFMAHCLLVNPRNWPPKNEDPFFKMWMGKLVQNYHFARLFHETKQLNYIDDVTGLYNQRYMFVTLDREVKRSQRTGDPFSVLFIDIDHFKQVNDANGHIVGSKILNELGKVFRKNIRSTDYGFRYGGDEYLLLLTNANSDTARIVAERIRQQVADSEFIVDGVGVQLTLSIGIASFPEHASSKEEILRLADQAMYSGKAKSRNIVLVTSR